MSGADSLEEFVGYLRLLADEFGRVPDDPAAAAWTNRSINDFLWGWVTAVRGHGDGEPGWQGLASQVELARTAKPGYNCVLADSGIRWDEVDSALHLMMYLATLATGFAREQREIAGLQLRGASTWGVGTWAHGRLDAFLGAWAAWLESAYLTPLPALMVKLGVERRPVEPVTWRSIALQLHAAVSYE